MTSSTSLLNIYLPTKPFRREARGRGENSLTNCTSCAPRLLLRARLEQHARAVEGVFETLPLLQHRGEEVTLALDASEHVLDVKVVALYLLPLDLFPFERRRDGRARLRPHRVGRDDRLATRVLHV